MKLPGLSVIPRKRDMINEFLGIDERTVISDGFFSEQKNVSMDKYPTMSRREGYSSLGTTDINISGTVTTTNVHGVVVMDEYVYMVLERSLYKFHTSDFPLYNLSADDITSRLIYRGLDYSTKQMVKMGAYIAILPDKIIVNTETNEIMTMDLQYISKSEMGMTVGIFDIDGNKLNNVVQSSTEPSTDKIWVEKNDNGIEAKIYSDIYSAWLPTKIYYGLSFVKYDVNLMSGDLVYIGYYKDESDLITNKDIIKSEAVKITRVTDEYFFWEVTDVYPIKGTGYHVNYYVPEGGTGESGNCINGSIQILRTSPDIDYMCAYNNRLWACSSENHEIYASAQGNPCGWYAYQGITSDSYAATVGSEGGFTGCIAYLDNVLFFKEDRIIRVYGTKPANYQISEIVCRGVKKGCTDSLVIADEILYYNSKEGILAYDGSFPSSISERLDISNTKNINLAIALDKKVYFFDRYGNTNYVYDVKRGLWTSYTLPYDSSNQVNKMDLFELEDEIYMCSTFKGMSGTYVFKFHSGECEEDLNEWKAVSGILGLDNPDNKYISMINIRVNLVEGSTFKVSMQYDDGDVKEACRVTAEMTKTFTIPIIPQRCDTFRIHLEGTGKFTLYSITKYTETGSDVGSDV